MNIELSGKIECYPPRESMRSLCLLNFNSALFSTISQNIPPPLSLSLEEEEEEEDGLSFLFDDLSAIPLLYRTFPLPGNWTRDA